MKKNLQKFVATLFAIFSSKVQKEEKNKKLIFKDEDIEFYSKKIA